MTFFNFIDGDRPQISSRIWIYVLVTIVLTVVIQTSWAIISQKKEKQIAQRVVSN